MTTFYNLGDGLAGNLRLLFYTTNVKKCLGWIILLLRGEIVKAGSMDYYTENK